MIRALEKLMLAAVVSRHTEKVPYSRESPTGPWPEPLEFNPPRPV